MLLIPFLVAALSLSAQTPDDEAPKDVNQLRQRLAEVQMHLSQVDKQMARLSKRRKGVLVELQSISLQADRIRAQAHGAKLKRDHAQVEVDQIHKRRTSIQKEIARLKNEVKRQIRWSQALGPLGGLGLFPSTEGFESFLMRGRYYEYWRGKQQRRLDHIQHLRSDLLQREKDLQAALKVLSQEEKEAGQYQILLRLSEERLQGFLDKLHQDEKRNQEAQAELAEEALQLERMLSQLLNKPKSETFNSTVSFLSLKGQLPQPVAGRLAQAYGEHLHPKFKTRTMQSGILIATSSHATVKAVADGKVIYADSYQSYGPMVVIDHGEGYFSIYTHLNGYNVSKDQIIKQGEALGHAGGTIEGSRVGFEIRCLATPQDPQKWLKMKYNP